MDTTDINTARKLWRWNLGGLGFSSTGYNGPYGIAITNDGKIVADFITTGVLNADLIKAGTLTAITISSEDGTSYWNLDTGTINLNKGSITGSNSSWNLDTGAISFTKGKISGSNSSWDLDSQIIQGSNVKINLADGNVSFSKGKISGSNSWWDLSTGECYFDKGTIKSATGSMNLGNGAVSFGNGNFTVGTNGNVNIKGQKITFLSGSTIYDNGSTFTLNGNGNSIFIQSTSSNWIRIANGFVDFGGTVTFANSIETNGITNSGNIKSGTITSTGKASISGDIWGYATLDIDGASYLRSSVDVYGITRCHSNLICQGSLAVNGTKNRIVDTENYGKLKLNAYETAESYFGDIGESETDHNGIKKIYLDSMFLETVNTSVPYQVFLTCYSDTDINLRVIERAEKYFVVKGAPNCSFGFEIKAKQKGYEKDRLEVFEEEIEEMSVNKEKIKNKKGE